VASVFAVWLLAALAANVAAQQNAVTLQLPTYSSFSVRTTVLVPDRGAAALGGIGRSATGTSQFGPAPLPAGTRTIGAQRQAQNAHIIVQIHDFRAMADTLVGEAVMPQHATGEGNRHRSVGHLNVLRPDRIAGASVAADRLHGGLQAVRASAVPTSGDTAGQLSVAEWKQRHAAQAQDDQRLVQEWMLRAMAAAESGNRAAARVYLTMAYRKADATLRTHIAAELERLAAPPAAQPPR